MKCRGRGEHDNVWDDAGRRYEIPPYLHLEFGEFVDDEKIDLISREAFRALCLFLVPTETFALALFQIARLSRYDTFFGT